jgi:hypothetical protein
MPASKKIPSTMLGMKWPAMLRNSDMLNAIAGSPIARQIVADALIAAAAAAAAVIAGKASKRSATKQAMQHVVGNRAAPADARVPAERAAAKRAAGAAAASAKPWRSVAPNAAIVRSGGAPAEEIADRPYCPA